MKKIKMKKLLCLLMAGTLSASLLASCGGGDPNAVRFCIDGTPAQISMLRSLVNEFNKTYGKEHGISVKASLATGDYFGFATSIMGTSSAPDVILMEDDVIKKWIIGDYIMTLDDINDVHTDISLGNVMPMVMNRLYYDPDTNTSNPETDSLYGLTVDACPTALFFNKGLMEKAGIFVISVDEDKLDEWNAGSIPDNYGKYKQDYSLQFNNSTITLSDVTVPAKGYYRSVSPYFLDEFSEGWQVPDVAGGEILVFNNRIAMNWDEVEDLAMYFSKNHNPDASGNKSKWGSTYGYFTETWFNYGWSVGGDCLQDLTGNGDWNFALLDPNPNYIVKEGETFTGRTGRVYQGGETLEFYDKMEAAENEVLVPDVYGDYVRAGSEVKTGNDVTDGTYDGVWTGVETEMDKGEESALLELPSTRTAFKRYLKLGISNKRSNENNWVEDSWGMAISPNPADLTGTSSASRRFYTGDLLCFVSTSPTMQELFRYQEDYNLIWDVAPIVQYKEYVDPADPDCDEVKVQGIEAGHSRNRNLGINRLSPRADAAKAFVKWACGVEGQRYRASIGYFPTQKELMGDLDFSNATYAPSNAIVFAEALEYQGPGDWWYMPDTLWVETWCLDLNNKVRNGQQSFETWYKAKVKATNNKLKDYKDYKLS